MNGTTPASAPYVLFERDYRTLPSTPHTLDEGDKALKDAFFGTHITTERRIDRMRFWEVVLLSHRIVQNETGKISIRIDPEQMVANIRLFLPTFFCIPRRRKEFRAMRYVDGMMVLPAEDGMDVSLNCPLYDSNAEKRRLQKEARQEALAAKKQTR